MSLKLWRKDNMVQMAGQDSSGVVKPLRLNEDNELNVNATDNLLTTTEDYAGAETNTVIINPGATESVEVHNVYVSSNVVNVDVTIKFATSGIIIFKLYTSQMATSASTILHLVGAANENVDITCGAGTFISITYHLK